MRAPLPSASFGVLAALAFFTSTACASLTKKVARDATPEAVDSAIETGLSEKNQEAIVEAIDPERVERATNQIAAATTDGWTNAMAEEKRQARVADTMAPIVASLIHEAMETALSDEHLARVRELAKQATLGFQDAIDEVSKQRDTGQIPDDEGNVLEAVDEMAEDGGRTLYVLGALAAVLAALVVGGTVWALSGRRAYKREVARRDEALEAAMRMLSREGMPLDESRSPGVDGDEAADADAELLRRALPRKERPVSANGSGTAAGEQGRL